MVWEIQVLHHTSSSENSGLLRFCGLKTPVRVSFLFVFVKALNRSFYIGLEMVKTSEKSILTSTSGRQHIQ